MKKTLFFALKSILFFTLISTSVDAFSQPVLIDNSLKKIVIGKNIEYLEDKENSMSIIDVQSSYFKKKWVKSEEDSQGFGFTKSVYWVRFELTNTASGEVEIYLEQVYPLIDSVTLFYNENETMKEIELGDRKPFSERLFEYKSFIFPLKLKPKSSTAYYLRYQTDSSMNIDLQIWSPSFFIQSILNESIFTWMFYGILLIMVIYNLFIFFTVKDYSYLYLILYISSYCLFMMSLQGLAFQHIWPDSIWWSNICVPVFMGIVNFSIVQFARYYIKIWKHMKSADLLLKAVFITALSFSVLTIIINNYRLGIIATTALTGADVVIGFSVLIYGIIKVNRVRELWIFLMSFLVFLIGILLYVLKTFAILPEVFITSYGIQIGAVLNVALLSFALADRINIMRKELQELNLNLEDKVKERTEELQAATEELEAMNESLIRINEDLTEAQRIAALDMKMASNVQSTLFPKKAPQTSQWNTAFIYRPMAGVSGDMYDFYLDNGELNGAILMDVSGHGIASGLVTMIARSLFSRNFERGRGKKLNQVLEETNQELISEMGDVENYLTGILLRLQDNQIEYVNAGHTDLLFRSSKSLRVAPVNYRDRDFKGMFLGIKETAQTFEELKFKISNGDALLLYSDCLTESKNDNGDEYGAARLIESFTRAEGSAQEMLDSILDDFYSYIGNKKLDDDLTAILLKRAS